MAVRNPFIDVSSYQPDTVAFFKQLRIKEHKESL